MNDTAKVLDYQSRLPIDPPLQAGGGGGTLDGMEDIHSRLGRLEGSMPTMQWSVALVSAALLGAGAILIALQLYTLAQVNALTAKVDALPNEIRGNLVEINKLTMEAIIATRAYHGIPMATTPSQQKQ